MPAKFAPSDQYCDTNEAAKILAVLPVTLRKWRHSKCPYGPPYLKAGRMVRYKISDLTEYLTRHTVSHKQAN
jgi:Helix-turn-helix domain